MTVGEAIYLVQFQISKTAGEEDLQQAKELVGFVCGISPSALMLHHRVELSQQQTEQLGEFAARRAAGEPLQYLLGEWAFMGLPMLTRPGVLIPRQDTEVLCEQAEILAKQKGYQTALDLCCGSGCIGIALNLRAGLAVTAVDISEACVGLTAENAALNEAAVDIRQGDLFQPVPGEKFDLIVSNPPYLSKEDMQSLQTELTYEPETALYGGQDGLDFYRRIADGYRAHLNPGGALLLEIGSMQADEAAKLFEHARVAEDYAGNPRVLIVEEK